MMVPVRCAMVAVEVASGIVLRPRLRGPPRARSIPSVIMTSARRFACCGQRFIRLFAERYGLPNEPGLPKGNRKALAAREWSVVKFCTIWTVAFRIYTTPTDVDGA